MVVTYMGDGCVRLQSGETSLLVNPTSNRLKADVTLKTLTLTDTPPPRGGEIVFPGEYEVKHIEIRGLSLAGESAAKYVKTVYVADWEDMRFSFLGHLSKMPDEDVREALGETDVLFVPTGDAHFISSEDAVKLIKQLEPHVVIPLFYKNPNEFLKAAGKKIEPQEKFVFKKKDIADKEMEIVLLEAKT